MLSDKIIKKIKSFFQKKIKITNIKPDKKIFEEEITKKIIKIKSNIINNN
jgi:hypothetical protein